MNDASNMPAVALNSEERLALDNIMLGEGFSDSTTSEIVQYKRDKGVTVKKCGLLTPALKNRDAMGNYVPPPGQKPLSKLGSVNPGPIYEPNYTHVQKAYPQYTLGGQAVKTPAFSPRGDTIPGPNKYDISGNPDWGRCRKITLKGPIATNHKTPGPGPTTAKMKPFKSRGPKYSMPGRTKKGPLVFKNNPHAMTVDPAVPGPEFKPSDKGWYEKPLTLGIKHRDEELPVGPGPCKYNLSKPLAGPRCTIGKAEIKPEPSKGPGPGRYKLRSTIGKGPSAPLGLKYHHYPPDNIPGPDIYHRAGFRLDEPGYTMKYRWFDSEPKVAPSPADYNARLPGEGPHFTIKEKRTETIHEKPGPADYEPRLENWDKPGKSIGSKVVVKQRRTATRTPDYIDSEQANKLLPSVPSYSFRKSEKKTKVVPHPPPSAYRPKLPSSKQTITLAKKIPDPLINKTGPGPAQPSVQEEELTYDPKCPKFVGGRAASLKSRHTPLKYTGHQRNIALLPHAPKEVACLPLF